MPVDRLLPTDDAADLIALTRDIADKILDPIVDEHERAETYPGGVFAQLGADGIYRADTSWYVGADLYHGFAFANAMNNLTSTMSSSFDAARAAGMTASTGSSSGFSGFSGGGGFGGGGGGSW